MTIHLFIIGQVFDAPGTQVNIDSIANIIDFLKRNYIISNDVSNSSIHITPDTTPTSNNRILNITVTGQNDSLSIELNDTRNHAELHHVE